MFFFFFFNVKPFSQEKPFIPASLLPLWDVYGCKGAPGGSKFVCLRSHRESNKQPELTASCRTPWKDERVREPESSGHKGPAFFSKLD